MIILVGMLTLFLQAGEATRRPCPTTHLDINTTSKEELVKVEGITPAIADKIIKGRPYTTSRKPIQEMMSKEVWEKFQLKMCLNGVILVQGNKLEEILERRKLERAEAPSDKPNAPQ